MFLTYLMFVVALCLSTVAAFYSIVGLTAIFSAAVIPIILMGSILEVAKLAVTVWLHEYWNQSKLAMKMYLVPAVGVLMLITSMGIFGFLSKAHLDQSLVSGDVTSKIALYDEKIRIARENIDANRRGLKQMDEAVDQTMGRSTSESGADKAVQIRRSQARERTRLLQDIEAEQKKITELNEARAPIAAEVRKVEAEVGPIKYIAALIYDENTDTNVLERAVRWVIIVLVVVFDPLAVMMLLAATESLKWERELRIQRTKLDHETVPHESNQPLQQTEDPPDETVNWQSGEILQSITEHDTSQPKSTPPVDLAKHAYLFRPFVPIGKVKPDGTTLQTHIDEEDLDDFNATEKEAMRRWKIDNPTKTLKEQRRLYETGKIDHLPWEDYILTPDETDKAIAFGNQWPSNASKGDMFVRIDNLPTRLFKFNGSKWIEVDKSLTDRYVYNNNYIDYLISQIGSGNYDTELLNHSERLQIEFRLKQDLN